MNKLTKSVIAAGGAVALLLSSGATLAYWQDTVNVGAPTTITAGDLRVAQKAAPTWAIKHSSGKVTPVADISAVRIVPGDQLIYSNEYAITAKGQNLSLKASVREGSIVPTNANNAADKALSERLKQSSTFSINGAMGATSTITHKKNEAGTYAVKIDVTLNWPTDASNNPAKSGNVNLSQFTIDITQIPSAG